MSRCPRRSIDGKITRHLDRDDMVANTLGTFNSMTVSCAQCHNHKFDPISMEDYYSLHAVFAAIDRADRRYYADPGMMKKRESLEGRQRELTAVAKRLEAQIKSNCGGKELAELDQKIAQAASAKTAAAPPSTAITAAWQQDSSQGQVGAGRSRQEPGRSSRSSSLAAMTTSITSAPASAFRSASRSRSPTMPSFRGEVQVVLDRTSRDVPNPGTQPQDR